MKKTITIFALLMLLCLLAACSAGNGINDATADGNNGAAEGNSAQTDTQAPDGEAEGWEEEWPEEYPVENYRLQDNAIAQTGDLNQYRYLQLAGAESYMDIAADYVRKTLDCGDKLSMEENSPHDGYANWFMTAPNGSASVSGSSITGRFCFSLYPGFDRVLEMSEAGISDRDKMEQAAQAFVSRFSGITGKLELLNTKEETQYYLDDRSEEMKDLTAPAIVYTFRSKTKSNISLAMQDGLNAPVSCGDSTIDDLRTHCFTVTVWPDGTVVCANNYITRAEIATDGTVRMPEERDLPELISYMSSMTEHDTIVIEDLRADSYNVYFGNATIKPTLTMKYHFESAPTDHQSTDFSIELFEH